MTTRELIRAMLYIFIKSCVLTLAALFIADDLGLLKKE